MNGFLAGIGVGVLAASAIFLLGFVCGSQRQSIALMMEVLADQAEEAMMTAGPPLGIEP